MTILPKLGYSREEIQEIINLNRFDMLTVHYKDFIVHIKHPRVKTDDPKCLRFSSQDSEAFISLDYKDVRKYDIGHSFNGILIYTNNGAVFSLGPENGELVIDPKKHGDEFIRSY